MTVCTCRRQRLFGDVAAGEMRLSIAGRVAREEWLRTPEARETIALDAFVVMPDHVHLLFGIVPEGGAGSAPGYGRGVLQYAPTNVARAFRSPSKTVGAAIRAFKGAVTRGVWAIEGREIGPVWQRGFYDRVVRNDREADAIRRYIDQNPARWTGSEDRPDGHRA